MIVISDTSAISNLLQIKHLALLFLLFEEIIIPEAVYEELCEVPTQKQILEIYQQKIQIQTPINLALVAELETELDSGEAQAIALAIENQVDFLIIDELKGRNIAESKGLKIIGVLGILLKAKEKGHIIAVKPLMEKLRDDAGFFIKPSLHEYVLTIAGE
jgi:uncharacterized protein